MDARNAFSVVEVVQLADLDPTRGELLARGLDVADDEVDSVH